MQCFEAGRWANRLYNLPVIPDSSIKVRNTIIGFLSGSQNEQKSIPT